MARRRYDSSDETLYVPVSPEEVDDLLAGKGRPLLHRTAIQHFLYRVRVSLATAETDNKSLKKALERATEKKRRMGAPTTLSPMDAVRYASPEEISAIVGHLNSAQLNALAAHVAEARGLREALAADLSRVRAAASQLSGRADLPAAVRAEFVKLLNQLPATPPPVATPRSLEMARLVGLVGDDDAPAPAELPPAEHTEPGDVLAHVPTDTLPSYTRLPDWQPGPGLT